MVLSSNESGRAQGFIVRVLGEVDAILCVNVITLVGDRRSVKDPRQMVSFLALVR
jgi:hypothetical protein